MTAIEFLSQVNSTFKGDYQKDDYHRMVRIATGLREMKLFPDTRRGGITSHVTVLQAAHFIRAVALNVNPLKKEEFQETIEQWTKLRSDEGGLFMDELARLLSDDGVNLVGEQLSGDDSSGLYQEVNRISFSLDRPFVTIIKRQFNAGQSPEEGFYRSMAYAESEVVYGEDVRIRPFERFAIIKRSSLIKFASALTFLPGKFNPKPEDEKLMQETLDYINLRTKIKTQ